MREIYAEVRDNWINATNLCTKKEAGRWYPSMHRVGRAMAVVDRALQGTMAIASICRHECGGQRGRLGIDKECEEW